MMCHNKSPFPEKEPFGFNQEGSKGGAVHITS
jgi:hypothetical protein